MPEGETISVEILGTRLQLRGGDDPEKVRAIAEYVRDRVQELSEHAPTVPLLQLALLTAINIADELYERQLNELPSEDLEAALDKANQILNKANNV